MTNEELEQEVKRLEEQITNLRIKILESKGELIPYKPYEVEVPEDIGDYYTVNRVGCIQKLNNESKFILENMYRRGLAFKTRKEAEKFDKERILINKMKDWAKKYNGGWTPDWKGSDDKFSIYYFHNTESFSVCSDWSCNSFTKLPYFKSEEIAREFIEVFGEEIKEVLC